MTAFALIGIVLSALACRRLWPMLVYKRLDFEIITFLVFCCLLMFMFMFALSVGVKW